MTRIDSGHWCVATGMSSRQIEINSMTDGNHIDVTAAALNCGAARNTLPIHTTERTAMKSQAHRKETIARRLEEVRL